MKVLFVCTGNVCRSLTAAVLARKLSVEAGSPWETRSCGTAAETYFRVPREIRALLAEQAGADVSAHVPRLVTEDWVDWAERIYVMEEGHRAYVADRFPQATRKTALLDPAGDVADPMGGAPEDYRACLDRIRACLLRLLKEGTASG
jgi:protein-tyrosine phosphatase